MKKDRGPLFAVGMALALIAVIVAVVMWLARGEGAASSQYSMLIAWMIGILVPVIIVALAVGLKRRRG